MSFFNTTRFLDGRWPEMARTQEFQLLGALATIAITALFLIINFGGILTAWPFFTRRYDFLKSNFEKSGTHMFSFKVLHVRHSIK
jgi:hypothetical protein